MIFSRLVGLRYCLYFFGTTVSLAALYTFVDILEKFTRYHDAPLVAIAQYAGIALIPNLIALSPIGCLLGSILLLREWIVHDQFLTMAIHGISKVRFAGIIFTYSFLVTSIIFILHETIGYQYTRRMTQAKTRLFNQLPQQTPWLRINATTFVMGLGHTQHYILQAGRAPSISVVNTLPQKQTLAAQTVNFQQETLTQMSCHILDKSNLSVLTYASTEDSLIQTLAQSSTRYGQRVISDLYFFFLKILFIPFFVVACFLLAIQRPFMRWIYAGLPYIAFGASNACTQLLGPVHGIILLSTIVLLLMAFFLFKIA